MKPYIFHILRQGRTVSDLIVAVCENDRAACGQAQALLDERPERHLVEVWEGERAVGLFERPPRAQSL